MSRYVTFYRPFAKGVFSDCKNTKKKTKLQMFLPKKCKTMQISPRRSHR